MDFDQLEKAIERLDDMIRTFKDTSVSYTPLIEEAVQDSLLKRFEYTLEVAWKTCKRYLSEEGFAEAATGSPKSIMRLAFEADLVGDASSWIKYINARQRISHDYSEEKASSVLILIDDFYRDVRSLYKNMTGKDLINMEKLNVLDVTSSQYRFIVNTLREKLPDVEVWFYGSRVKGTSKPSSDLDIVVFVSEEEKEKVYELRDIFAESELPFRVEPMIWSDIPDSFKENIKKEKIIFEI